MYKAIIVDDEAVVRRGLRNTIDWTEHGFELVGDYTNGREALEAVEELRPDLIVSDISMPMMDGLELAASVTSQYPYMKIVILTGYDEFEYAQQALRLKVTDFILKPITAQEMRQLLDKIRCEMDEEEKRHKDYTQLQTLLHQSLPLLKERFLERLAAAGMNEDELRERLTYFELPMLIPPMVAVVIDPDGFGDTAAANRAVDEEILRLAAFDLAADTVKDRTAVLFRSREQRMVLLLWGASDEEALYEEAFRIAENIRHRVERYLKFTVTAGIGEACASPLQLPASYKGALSALDYRFMLGKNRIISIRDIEGKRASALPPGWDYDRKLVSAVKTGSQQEAYRLIEELISGLRNAVLPLEACLLHTQKASLALLSAGFELMPEGHAVSSGYASSITEISQLRTLDEIEAWMKRTSAAVIRQFADNRDQYTALQMTRAAEYIETRYANERMSLQELCRHVHMSASYFSLVFKKHTGATFIEYLTRIRVGKAKELLLNSPLRLYEIAEKVGYADPNYFSMLFKKHTGQTPREYRDSGKERDQ